MEIEAKVCEKDITISVHSIEAPTEGGWLEPPTPLEFEFEVEEGVFDLLSDEQQDEVEEQMYSDIHDLLSDKGNPLFDYGDPAWLCEDE